MYDLALLIGMPIPSVARRMYPLLSFVNYYWFLIPAHRVPLIHLLLAKMYSNRLEDTGNITALICGDFNQISKHYGTTMIFFIQNDIVLIPAFLTSFAPTENFGKLPMLRINLQCCTQQLNTRVTTAVGKGVLWVKSLQCFLQHYIM